MNEYKKQAIDFLKSTNTNIIIIKDGVVDHFPNGENKYKGFRQKYKITLYRNGLSYSFPFYGSIAAYQRGEDITVYDVLACCEKYEPAAADVWDFADEFGYTISSQKEYNRVNRIYNSCVKQYNALLKLFGEENMERLQEIN